VGWGGERSGENPGVQGAGNPKGGLATRIFDAGDAGVGGGTADIVGQELRRLATTSQVLCVTHLPQVASKGQQHFRVSKLSDGRNTRTRITELTRDERIEELARMLGTAEITKRTRDHAAEMLKTGSAD